MELSRNEKAILGRRKTEMSQTKDCMYRSYQKLPTFLLVEFLPDIVHCNMLLTRDSESDGKAPNTSSLRNKEDRLFP